MVTSGRPRDGGPMAVYSPQAGSAGVTGSRLDRALLALLRIGIGFLWIQNASWKLPPRFELLRGYTNDAIVHPVFPPYSWLVEHLVLPNFTFFGWGTLILESCLGAFLL